MLRTRALIAVLTVSLTLSTAPVAGAALGSAGAPPVPAEAPGDLAAAVETSTAVTRDQADQLGIALPTPSTPAAASPSDAAFELFDRVGYTPTPDQAQRIAELDTLPEPAAGALADTLGAFLALEAVSHDAYADGHATPAELGEILSARVQLTETVPALDEALAQTSGGQSTVDEAPVLAIDLECGDTTYESDYVFILDQCGDDRYENNAGGTIDFDTTQFPPAPNPGCRDTHPGPTEAASVSAAVIDLAGNDRYGVADRGCGVNGGGILGTGYLFDAGGADEYFAGRVAVNGGAHFGVGHLMDAGSGGQDTFAAVGQGANGGGFVAGVGTLVDTHGGAEYSVNGTQTQREQATNGGGFLAGVGALVDGHPGSATFTGDGPEWSTENCAGTVCLDAPLPDDDGLGIRADL